jgi:hypothetical protein
MIYALVIILGTGSFVLHTYDGPEAMPRCVADGMRIAARDRAERRDDRPASPGPTYPGFVRAHCEAVSR